MANGSNRFTRCVKCLHQFKHFRIQAQIFWRPSAGDQQRVIIRFFRACKIGVENKAVAGFLAVSLGAVKVMDGGHNVVAFDFVRTDRINLMTNHL
ncbi:Uncharacterised protein [Klebsiella pneumoniae]|nr:Uncharacterised protein [Klebsiella pneumoniae]